MKTIAKCPRCGKEKELTFKQAGSKIKCHHCNCMMKLDKKTEKATKITNAIVAAVFILTVTFIYSFFGQSLPTVVGILIIIGSGLLVASVSQPVANYLVYQIKGFSYERDEKQ